MASVERRSGKRGDVYVVRYRDDERRQRSKSFAAHIDAVRFSNRIEVQLAEGDYIDPTRGRTTFGEFHARWMAARTVSSSRAYAELGQARNHVLPRWARVPLSRISPLDVDAWVKSGITTPSKNKNGAAARVQGGAHLKRDVLKHFKLCLDAAVREGILRSNPAATTRAPAVPRKQLTAIDVLEADELRRLASAMPERWQTFVFLSGWIGWRWSEAMGLRASDVDLVAGTLHLGRQVAVEVGGRVEVRTGGKTRAATRSIPLPTVALDALQPVVEARSAEDGPDARLWVTAAGTTPCGATCRGCCSGQSRLLGSKAVA